MDQNVNSFGLRVVIALLSLALCAVTVPSAVETQDKRTGRIVKVERKAGLTADEERSRRDRIERRQDEIAELSRCLLAVDGERPVAKSGVFNLVRGTIYYRHAYGDTWFVMGEVINNGSGVHPFVEIGLSFRNSSGVIIASDTTYVTGQNRTLTSIDSETDTCLAPGETGFFGTYVDVDMGAVSSFSYGVDASDSPTVQPDARIILHSGPNATNSYGDVRLRGQLKNVGMSDAHFVIFHAALKDASDRMLDVEFTYVNGSYIGGTDTGLHRDEIGSFDMYTDAPYSEYSRRRTKIGWDDYGAVHTCSYSISPTSRDHSAAGGTGTVSVSTDTSCSWTASANSSWLHITSGSSGSGSGTVAYRVDANSQSSTRHGTMFIAGKTFTVHQQGRQCYYSVDPASVSFSASGGEGLFEAAASYGCQWTAQSDSPWLTVTSGASGTGDGTVRFRVARNTGAASRSGSIQVESATFTVNQSGAQITYMTGGIASISGSHGSRWRSSFAVCNPSDHPVDVIATFRHSGGSIGRTFQLAASEIRQWGDVTHDLFWLSDSVTGCVEISTVSPLVVTARTYNDSTDGTFGQFLPAITAEECIGTGETGILSHLASSDQFRTNIGFVNPGDAEVEVEYRLISTSGQQLGNPLTLTIPPTGWAQQNGAFSAAGAPDADAAFAKVSVVTPNGHAWAYASVIDNDSGDPTTIPMEVAGGR